MCCSCVGLTEEEHTEERLTIERVVVGVRETVFVMMMKQQQRTKRGVMRLKALENITGNLRLFFPISSGAESNGIYYVVLLDGTDI